MSEHKKSNLVLVNNDSVPCHVELTTEDRPIFAKIYPREMLNLPYTTVDCFNLKVIWVLDLGKEVALECSEKNIPTDFSELFFLRRNGIFAQRKGLGESSSVNCAT
eukprot:TRINITY_DN14188_c0_g1_i1.p1 TRINITY_DN14188_c0_g1~~TRINITY_DN14188_c0_g1_i1.p1  ORF type:complete len:106 (-),score=8.83 TRINITY_DN14188_c0_g1_i1:83-400(-)